MLKVRRGGAPPTATQYRDRIEYPFKTMDVGTWFVVPKDDANRARSACGYHSKDGNKFTARQQPDGSLKVWRVA